MLNFDIIFSPIIDFARLDFEKIITEGYVCPVIAPQCIIFDNPQNIFTESQSITYPNFEKGYYYRIPVSSTVDSNNKILPKYSGNLPLPFFALEYPNADVYSGYFLIKTKSAIEIMQNDIIIMTENQALLEVNRIVETIFAI